MPYKDKSKQAANRMKWAKNNPDRIKALASKHYGKWAKNNPEKRRAANRRHMGEPGSPERDRYNEKRRLASKRACLVEIEASRKHKDSLREFITRKAA